jgi:hypothetical protein
VDSLAAVELRNLVSAKFAISLPTTLVFDYPTAAALAAFVAKSLAGRQIVDTHRLPRQVPPPKL